jgi:hypothetical protein
MAIDIEIGHVFFFFAPGMGIRMQKWFLLLSPRQETFSRLC